MSLSCVVVIPVYKTNPKPSEIASFKQCLTVLNDHEIVLVTYKECDLSVYDKISDFIGKKYIVVFFNKSYFNSLEDYNKLCLSNVFYDKFISYEYMLIYQLDAWVFSDQLRYWCDKNYDYIGAPLFYENEATVFIGVGNGGFSLRRISYCKDLLSKNRNRPYIKPYFLWKWIYASQKNILKKKYGIFSFSVILIKVLLGSFGFRNTLNYLISSSDFNEDFILGVWGSQTWNVKAKIPSSEEASLFAFEVNPSFLYEKNSKLPFGCHAFEKWEFNKFWYKYIRFEL